ncbi:MAG: PKD domain-containing protein [Nitrospirota bacterium]|nr:PKD domain-containing protein [Nitrospirota bacterium]
MNSKDEEEMWPETFEDVSRNNNSSAVYPCFGVRNKDIYASWLDNRNGVWDIFYSEKIQDEWNLPTQINRSGEKYWPSLALDREDNVHIIYSTKEGNIFYVKRVSGIWSSPLLISTGFRPACIPCLKLFKNNTLHAVWIQETDSGVSIFYGRGTSNGQWLEPIQISVGNEADKPSIELDDSGNAHIVWEDTGINNKKDIFYTVVTPFGLKPTAVFSPSKDSGIVPFTVYFDASGSAPGEGVIRSYCWDFGDGSEIEEGRQISHTFEQAGIFSVKLYVTNSQLLVASYEKEIQILSGPFPPTDIVVKKTQEGGLFYREKINAISWKENPENKGQVSISHYNVYRKFKNRENSEFEKIGQVSGMTYKYGDRDFVSPEDRDKFVYALSAVDDKGREGPLGFALYPEEHSEIKAFKSTRKEIK